MKFTRGNIEEARTLLQEKLNELKSTHGLTCSVKSISYT